MIYPFWVLPNTEKQKTLDSMKLNKTDPSLIISDDHFPTMKPGFFKRLKAKPQKHNPYTIRTQSQGTGHRNHRNPDNSAAIGTVHRKMTPSEWKDQPESVSRQGGQLRPTWPWRTLIFQALLVSGRKTVSFRESNFKVTYYCYYSYYPTAVSRCWLGASRQWWLEFFLSNPSIQWQFCGAPRFPSLWVRCVRYALHGDFVYFFASHF